MLSTNVEPVDSRRVGRIIRAALALGAAAVVLLVLAALGVRGDAGQGPVLAAVIAKLGFTLLVLVVASHYLIKLARPGGERSISTLGIILPFVAIMLLAVASLSIAPHSHWRGLILGDQWLECVVSIPLIAIVPFAVIIGAVRQTAPTDLARAGAIAGLVAGCLSATGYALHCTDDSVPFVAIWYGGTIALCTLLGWKLGPRLLRW